MRGWALSWQPAQQRPAVSGWTAAARALSLIRQLRGTLVAILCGLYKLLTQPHTASRLQHGRSAL